MFKYEPARIFEEHQAFCDLPFTKLILNGWGDVSMCCYQLEQIGSVLNGESLLDLWRSAKAKEIRKTTEENRLHRVCKSWNTCPFQVKQPAPGPVRAYKDCDYPTWLEICLPNTHCNIGGETPSEDNPACIMCCRNFDFKPQPPITDMLCEKAKPLMPYLERLCVLGVAEPFWKDATFKVFEKLEFSRWKHRCRFETNNNGVCLTPHVTDRFFEEVTYSEISFSLDAATPGTYMKIRRHDLYDMVVENLAYFVQQRNKYGGPQNHKVVIYNNINLLNVDEMSKMVVTAAKCGVDQITMIPTHDQCGRVFLGELLLNEKNVKLFKKNSEDAMKMAQQLGVPIHYPKPFDVVPPPVGDLVNITI